MMMSKNYRAMTYAAVATFHFYRNDIVPLNEGETAGVFAEKNKDLIKRVTDEILNVFCYELSQEQMGRAIEAYTASARPLRSTEAFTPAAVPQSRSLLDNWEREHGPDR